MKTLLRISFMVLLAFRGVSQETETAKPERGMGGGGLTVGYGYMDMSDLKIFAPAGVGALPSNHLLLGGSGYGMMGRLVLGGSGFGIISKESVTDSVRFSVGGGAGMFHFGYLLCDCKKMKIFPTLGVGGRGMNVQIARNRDIRASDVATQPGQEINLNSGSLLLDAGITFKFIPFLHYDEKEKSYGGFMAGLKIGYVYGVQAANWTFRGGDVTGGPSFRMNMPYVQLIIGGFGMDAR